MIYLTIRGGIGNQMFQYALARDIAEKTGQEIIFDLSSVKNDNLRDFKLNNCYIPNNIARCRDTIKSKIWNKDFNLLLKIALKVFNKKLNKLLYKNNIFICDDSNYIEINVNSQKDIYLYGWWQSENYFRDSEDIVKKDLKINESSININNKLLNKISNSQSVCIHFRKGDYLLKKNQRYQVCSVDYYKKGINYLREDLSNPLFFIFSDNIDQVKQEIGEASDIIYVDNCNSDIDELFLMYNCKNFIISNSSFSWWAQYLSDNKDKIVIAPEKWTNDGRTVSIYQDNWILL